LEINFCFFICLSLTGMQLNGRWSYRGERQLGSTRFTVGDSRTLSTSFDLNLVCTSLLPMHATCPTHLIISLS
jgi:hypothetical protein